MQKDKTYSTFSFEKNIYVATLTSICESFMHFVRWIIGVKWKTSSPYTGKTHNNHKDWRMCSLVNLTTLFNQHSLFLGLNGCYTRIKVLLGGFSLLIHEMTCFFSKGHIDTSLWAWHEDLFYIGLIHDLALLQEGVQPFLNTCTTITHPSHMLQNFKLQ